MKIVCPYVDVPLPETEDCLDLSGLDIDYVDTSDDERAYGRLLCELWAADEGFIIVEMDMAFEAEQLFRLIDCPEPYCAGVYDWTTNTGPAMGFTKFGAELIEACPRAGLGLSSLSWRQLDVIFMRRILGHTYGWQPHVHLPPVRHLNPAQSPLREEFRHLSVREHLEELGWRMVDDENAVYIGGRFFGAARAA